MELRHLRYFVAVAEELHFSRAAIRLGISQPPLSQQIQHLEQEVGTPLLLRTRRHVELTTAGRALLEQARRILSVADEGLHTVRRVASGETGRLMVGFVGSAVYGRFPRLFRRMRERCPEVSLRLSDLSSEEQVAAIKARQLDVGLVRPPLVKAKGLSMEVLWSETFLVALPENHPLAKRKQVPLSSLAEEPFLMVSRELGPGFYDQILQLCAAARFTPRVEQEVRSTPTLLSLVAGNLGVSLVPSSLQSFQAEGVVFRPLPPPVPRTNLAMIWRPEDSSPVLRVFLETLRQVVGQEEFRERKKAGRAR
jgi:DNA-binding transcriptional LysR family regulator